MSAKQQQQQQQQQQRRGVGVVRSTIFLLTSNAAGHMDLACGMADAYAPQLVMSQRPTMADGNNSPDRTSSSVRREMGSSCRKMVRSWCSLAENR